MLELIDENDVSHLGGKDVDHIGTICCICRSDTTYIMSDGKPHWFICHCHKDSCTGYICKKCYAKIRNDLPDSYKNVIKQMRLSRTGNLSKHIEHGKIIISQWIVAKTLGIRDLNIDNDNFNVPIDLSCHNIYGKPDVKFSSKLGELGRWHIDIGKYYFDVIVILIMEESWKDIERVYIIPKAELHVTHIGIYKDLSKSDRYEKYRVDKRSFSETYNGVDIPEFPNPWDLWNGKYDKSDINKKS